MAPDAASVADERLLTSLAVLQVNWDVSHRSYLDSFVPFVIEAMRRNEAADFSNAEVADALHEHFGLRLPVNIVGAILSRAAREKYGSRSSAGRFQPDTSRAAFVAIAEHEQRVLREQRNLTASLARFARESYGTTWSDDDARDSLLDYVEANAPGLLGTALRGQNVPEPPDIGQTQKVIVSAWIEEIHKQDPTRFEFLLTLVKGSMLAAGMGLYAATDRTQQQTPEGTRPFKKTQLVLDTPVVLKALGYEGDELRDAMRDTMALARRQGAELSCLVRTVKEVRGVLTGAAQKRRPSQDFTRGVDVHFAESGYTRSDVLRCAERLEQDLRGLGIVVVDSPPPDPRYTVDEAGLEDALERKVRYPGRNGALIHDLEAITAIHRMRGDRAGDRLETCRAVLITTNEAVVRTARRFPDLANHDWPVAMTVQDLATLLWVKEPMAAPDLPRHQLLARCYTVLAPSGPLWEAYLCEVERLRSQGRIDEDDVKLLRYSQAAQRALVEETTMQDTGVDADIVGAVLHRVRASVEEPLARKLAQFEAETEEDRRLSELELERIELGRQTAEARAERAELHLRALHEERSKVVARVTGRCQSVGRLVGWGVTALIVLTLATSLVWDWGPLGLVARLIMIAGAVAGNLMGPGRRLEAAVAGGLTRRRLRALGLDETTSDLDGTQPSTS